MLSNVVSAFPFLSSSLHYRLSAQKDDYVEVDAPIEEVEFITLPLGARTRLVAQAAPKGLILRIGWGSQIFPVMNWDFPHTISWVRLQNERSTLFLESLHPPLFNILEIALAELRKAGMVERYHHLLHQIRQTLTGLNSPDAYGPVSIAAIRLPQLMFESYLHDTGRCIRCPKQLARFRRDKLPEHLEAFSNAARHTVQQMLYMTAISLGLDPKQAFTPD